MELKNFIIPIFTPARHKRRAPAFGSEEQALPSGMWSHIVLHTKYCTQESTVWSKE